MFVGMIQNICFWGQERERERERKGEREREGEEFFLYPKLRDSLDYGEKVDKSDTMQFLIAL